MFKILEQTVDRMPSEKPRYLMGVGTPSDILGAVKTGIDMFDSVCLLLDLGGLALLLLGKVNLIYVTLNIKMIRVL